MKKQTFNISRVNHGKDYIFSVTGWTSGYFGIHKNPENKYNVTHLRTGKLITEFNQFRQAEDFIFRLNFAPFPVDWNTTAPGELSQNANKAKKLANLSRLL